MTFLIENGADVNSANESGETPLFLASESGKYSTIFLKKN